jgi:hypothetical protein
MSKNIYISEKVTVLRTELEALVEIADYWLDKYESLDGEKNLCAKPDKELVNKWKKALGVE